MKSKLFRVTTLFVTMTLLAVLFLGTAGGHAVAAPPAGQPAAVTQAQDGGGIITAASSPGWTASTKVWTKEEMLAAKPMPLPSASGEPVFDISQAAPDGAPGLSPSALPADVRGALVNAEPDFLEVTSPLGYTYPPPFTRYNNFDRYSRFPYLTIGKLFFTQYGTNYVCSAASVGNYAIWTAGHCVHYGNGSSGGWSYNVAFVPAYSNGAAPFGTWTASNVGTIGYWYNSGDLRFDFGFVILNTLSGLKISQRVGNLGFAWNQSTNLHWFSIGYPQAYPFSGKWQVICASSYAYSDTSFGTPYPVAVGCDQTGGTSGGPRIWKLYGSGGATNYVNGDNSYRYTTPDHPKELFSPYFGTDAGNIFNYALSCNPGCP